MRIGCIQFIPVRGDLSATIRKVDGILSKVSRGSLSVLIMPEMTFPGYSFTAKEIKDLLDSDIHQKTIDWGIKSAINLDTYIQLGYPRIASDKQSLKIYNSVSLISPTGDIVYTYDKHFLFSADELWATAGDGFRSYDCIPFGKVGPGICMDVNPYKFEAPFNAFEFANFHTNEQTKFVFLSMAWIKSNDTTPVSLIYYWIQRLQPFLESSRKSDQPIIVVISNRNGTEGDTTYAGSSCVLRFTKGRVSVVGHLNMEDERLLTVDI